MATYLRLASDIRHGQFPDHYDYQPFYYTVVLPLVVPDSGSKFWLLALQTIIGAGTVYLCGLCAAIVFGRVYGWVAAALLALARFHVFYTPFALYEVLQSFWIALLCYLTLRAWQHNRLRQWLMSAVVGYADRAAAIPEIGYVNPCGQAVDNAYPLFQSRLYKDGYHLSPVGEYLQALVWTEFFTGAEPCDFVPEEVAPMLTADEAVALRKAAHEAVLSAKITPAKRN